MNKNLLIWFAVSFILVLTLQNSIENKQEQFSSIAYNQFIQQVEDGKIESVTLQGQDITARTESGQQLKYYATLR